MSRFTKLDIIDYLLESSYSSSIIFPFNTELDLFPSLDHVTTITTTRRRSTVSDVLYLKSLSDRVSALELSVDPKKSKSKVVDRKYTWTAEIKGGDIYRKYKIVSEIKGGKKKERRCKWTAEIKRKGDDVVKYSFSDDEVKLVKNKEKRHRIVEIQQGGEAVPDHATLLLKQAFNRAMERNKGKKKELSPQDAALLIQMTFRAYLIKRSQSLRALRQLSIAKGKLKELAQGFVQRFLLPSKGVS